MAGTASVSKSCHIAAGSRTERVFPPFPHIVNESSFEKEQRLSRSREDEKLSRDLAAYLDQPQVKDALDPHPKIKADIRAIGNYPYANGGYDRMGKVHDQVQALGADVHLLDLCWKGIGE